MLKFRLSAVVAAAVFSLAAAPLAIAGITVPAGASVALNGGQIDAGSTDIDIAGAMQLGSGNLINVTNFNVGSGGSAQLDGGSIQLSGDWSNLGNIASGTSQVAFTDGTATSSAILGATSFNAVSFVSATGKTYRFETGQTQIINAALMISGTASQPIQFASTAPGITAFLNLLAGGSQNISDVGVSDVHATGQHLAPALTNRGGSGNDYGWFGNGLIGPYIPVPTLSPWAAGGLLLLLWLLGVGVTRRDRRPASETRNPTTPWGN